MSKWVPALIEAGGAVDGAVETITGTVDAIVNIDKTVVNLYYAVTNPDKVYEAIKISVTEWHELYDYALKNDPALSGEMMGYLEGKVAGEAATGYIMGGAAAKVIRKVASLKDFSKLAKITAKNEKYVDILSPEAKQHILYGDNLTSGGHMYPGNPGKSVFPKSWSADKIVHEIGDIATSPETKWYAQTGTGGKFTSKGKPANWVSYTMRDSVRVRVVYQPATGKIITAFPDKNPIPTNYKLIK